MFKFKRYSKRTIAAFLSVMIVISAISCTFTLFSAALSVGDVTVLDSTDGIVAAKSVVDSEKMEVGFQKNPATGVYNLRGHNSQNLADGNFGTQAEYYWSEAPFFDLNAGYTQNAKDFAAIGTKYLDGSERFFQAVLPLKGVSDLSNILVVSHDTPALRTYYYEIFASNNKATLFDSANSVYLYTNTQNTKVQNFKIADGKLTGITYVGLRVYNPCFTENGKWDETFAANYSADIYYPRIFEFNAYGTVTAPVEEAFTVTSNDTVEIPSGLGEKAYSDVNANFYNKVGANTASFNASQLNGMLDDNAGTERQFMGNNDAAVYTENGGEYMNFDFEIKNNFIIRKILLMNHTNNILATKRYDILVADTKAGLDTAVPLICYENQNGDATQVFTVKADEGIRAKYLRVKVLLPLDWAKFKANGYTDNAAVCRFNEMGVFGEYDTNAKFQFDITHKDSNLTYPNSTNLTAGLSADVTYRNPVTNTTITDFSGDETRLSDADASTDYNTSGTATHAYMDGETLKWYTKENGVYSEITYNLGTIDTITDIVVNNHPTREIRMGSYELYISETLAGLEKAENLVTTVSTGGNRQQTIHFANEVKGQYIRLRTYDVCYNKSWSDAAVSTVYLRLTDFVAYGTKGTSSAVENIVLKAESNNTSNPAAGKTSVVKDVTFRDKSWQFSEGSTVPRISGANAPSALEALTDETVNNEVAIDTRFAKDDNGVLTTIYNDGVTAYTNIIYSLDGVADISDIVVIGHPEPTVWGISYDLYAGNDLSTLFNGEPLYSFKNTGSRTQHFEVKDLKAAYLAMRITSACYSTKNADYDSFVNSMGISIIHPRLFEFNVYGTAGEPLDAANFTEGNNLAAPTEETIVKNTTISYFNGTEEAVRVLSTTDNLIDNNITNEFMGSDEQTPFAVPDSNPIQLYGDRYVKIVHTLKDNAKISKIFAGGHNTVDLRPNKYKIYASSTLDTLWEEANLVYDFTNTNKSRYQQYTLIKEAQYVGMLITEPVNEPFAAVRLADQIYPRLSEFNVYGTYEENVVGQSGITDIANNKMPTDTNNILKGKVAASGMVYNKTLGKSSSVSMNNAPDLTDENMSTDWRTGPLGKDYFTSWNEETNKPGLRVDGSVYVDVAFNLGGTSTIDKFYVGHHTTKERRCKKYEIYASDTDDEVLFSEENLVKTVNNENAAYGQVITFDAPLTGVRNIGLRIINPVWDESFALTEITADNMATSCNVYPRICEFAAYGTFEADPYVFQRVINNPSPALPSGIDLSGLNNLAVPLNAKLQAKNTVTGEITKVSAGTKSANMKDGSFGTETEIMYRFADWTGKSAKYYVNGERYLDIYYDLGSVADVKYFVIGNHPTRELVTGKYDVYIGNNKESLYDPANLYTSVDNITTYNKGGTNQVNVIAFDSAQTGIDSKIRYIGIRMHTPVCATEVTDTVTVTETTNNIYPRIREFSVYGNYLDPNYVPGVNKFQDVSKMNIADVLKNGENLLKREKVTYMMDGKRAPKLTSSYATIEYDFWKDNSGAKHYDFGSLTGAKPTLVFKLDQWEMTEVTGFAFQGITSDSEAYYASHIKVHVAEEREDVTLDSSVVCEYYLDDDGMNKGLYYEFPKGSEPQGAFIAFEFVNPVNTATQHVYPRISLLYAWGKEAIVRGYPGNIAENMPIDAAFDDNGKLTEVSEENLTATEVKYLTDSNPDTVAKIQTKGKDREVLDITYNLCGDIKIDKIKLNTLINSKTGFKTMKVYVANTAAAVKDESSLIWTYKVGSKTGEIKPTKTFSKSKQMRYIRFVFEDTKDYVEIGDIEVIGMDNQKMKTRTLTNNIVYEDMSITFTPEGGEPTYTSILDSYFLGLIDKDKETTFTFYNGVAGSKDKYDILMYLGDLRTISNVTVGFIKHFEEYRPGTINVYIAETEETVNSKDTKPTFTIKPGKVKGDSYSKQMRPVLGRYIRFEVTDFPILPHFYNPDGTPRVSSIMGDIKITGTKVKGLQTSEESDVLLTFEDEDTKIGASIVRMDINDIFTAPVSIRVTEEKATNWQKTSMKNNLLKVIGNKVYKVELLDMYGKVVNDLDGRDIKISIPLPDGMEATTAVLGNATLRTKIEALDTYTVNGRVETVFNWSEDGSNKFVLMSMTTSEDEYWSTIGELENFEEGTEEDLMGNDFEVHDATWYESIHTTDARFTVTPINFQFKNGIKFVAEDISATAPTERYESVLSKVGDKKVAIYYDMKLYEGDSEYKLDLDPSTQAVDIYWNIPEEVSNYFTDLEVYHIDDLGNVTPLFIEYDVFDPNKLLIQTSSFSDFVVVGTAIDGYVGTPDTGIGPDGSPVTGESTTALATTILFMVAAAYVLFRSGKKATK